MEFDNLEPMTDCDGNPLRRIDIHYDQGNTMIDMSKMTPLNHHLLTAYYAWLAENGARIHLGINGILLEENHFLHAYENTERRIALSVGPNAVRNFFVDADGVSFDGTFGGQHMSVSVPLDCIEGVTGWLPSYEDQPVGFHLPPMVTSSDAQQTESRDTPPKKGRPNLSVVK